MNQPALVDNPFGKTVAAASNNAMAASESERSIQEVQAAMVIAKKFPRDTMKAMDRILNACTRPTLAAGALYSYPRGGQEITGPSIRLAEALAQEWGNMQFGIRELSSENGSSTVEAFAWDMETNTRQVKVFQVGHVRYSRSGGLQKLTDPRDIYEMIANQGARRLRACILGVIPGDVTESAVNQCEVTQATTIEVTPETIKAMISAFEQNYGVSKELIEKRLGKHAEAINSSQLLSLRKIYQGLKDGISKPADWFDMESGEVLAGPKVSELNEALTKKPPAKKAAKPEVEVKPDPVLGITYADVANQFNEATNDDEIIVARDLMRDFLKQPGCEKYKVELDDVCKARMGQLASAKVAEEFGE